MSKVVRFSLMMLGVMLATMGAMRVSFTRSGYVLSGSVLMNEPALAAGLMLLALWAGLTIRQGLNGRKRPPR